MTTSTADREIVITRVLNAPRGLVFKVFTEPAHVARWWGPAGFTNTIHDMDVRVGGTWLYVMHGPDGTDYQNKIQYTEVVKPERLAFRHGDWENVFFDSVVTFEELPGKKTKITMKLVFDTAEACEATRKHGAVEGGNQTLSKLETYLSNVETQKDPVPEFTFSRVFNSPRSLVFKAFTDPECLKHWWGPKGFECVVSRFNLRPGGEYVYHLKSEKGFGMWGKWVFREIAGSERLVFLSSFCDETGKTTTSPFPMDFPLEVYNVWTLTEDGGKTTLMFQGSPHHATPAQHKTFEELNKSMQQGYGGTMDQLEAFLAELG